MEYKLKETVSKDAFRYGYLVKKVAPFLKPHLPRIILNLVLAIPLGLLDGVVAFALKPYMDCVINGKTWTVGSFTLEQNTLAVAIPFGIILFALVEGLLKYANNYLTDWTGNKISNALKVKLFNKLTTLDPKFYDINSSGLVLTRFYTDPETASKNIINTLTLIFHVQSLTIVTLAATHLTGHIYIRQKMHFDLFDTVALARLTTTALDVKGKSSRLIALCLSISGACKEIANITEKSHVGCGI